MLLPVKVNKVEADLKKLTKLDGNKLCANCQEKIPGYAEMTHCIFIWLETFKMFRNRNKLVFFIHLIFFRLSAQNVLECIESTNIK